MNILCLDQSGSLGGAQRCLTDLLPGFLKRGWQLRLGIAGHGPLENSARQLEIPIDILPGRSYRSRQKSVSDFPRYLRHNLELIYSIDRLAQVHKPDLLYVNGPRLMPASALVGRLHSIPLVFHCHNRPVQHAASWLLDQSLWTSDARVIACCSFVADPIRHVPKDRVSVIYNGIDEATPYQPRERIHKIGVVGRVEPEKGQLGFVSAARCLSKRSSNLAFLVIGAPMFSGSEYFDQVVAASRGLPIEFTGWRNDAATVLSDIDLLVVPSTPVDFTPRVIVEAFAAGVPVVAFPSGGIPELVKDSETGFLTTSKTVEALVDRIWAVVRMQADTRLAVIKRAHEAWNTNYNLERFQKAVVDLLSASVEQSRAPSQSGKQTWRKAGDVVH